MAESRFDPCSIISTPFGQLAGRPGFDPWLCSLISERSTTALPWERLTKMLWKCSVSYCNERVWLLDINMITF